MTTQLLLNTQRPWELIRQCPAYQSTPIREIFTPGGRRTLIKDETNRFNLGAFKALGGIYAIVAFLLDRWQSETQTALDPKSLFNGEVQSWCSQFTFLCASAGNHGIAVAKGAQLVNARCRVYLSDSVPESFARKLTALNAVVVRSGKTYEDSMEAALEACENTDNTDGESNKSSDILLSDSSWPGYTERPTLVMEGYTVLAEEMRQGFQSSGDWPDFVFLQAGVGGLAAAIACHIRLHWELQPRIVVVEPDAATCLLESNKLGKLTTVQGPMSSMARLDCKEPSLLAFTALQDYADFFVCVSDANADDAVCYLENNGIQTTPSGAAGVAAILNADQLHIPLKDDSSCLAIATEGPDQ